MNKLASSNKKKVYEIIFEKIQREIASGHLKIGDKLPPERELAVQYSVSRTSIREALRLLELSSVIEIRQGDGTFIKNISVPHLQDQLSDVLIKTDKAILYEMLELRLILESECAALAALRATGHDLEKIAHTVEAMNIAHDDEEAGLQADLAFHMAIAQSTNNSVLVQLIASFEPHMRNTIEVTRKHRLSSNENITRTLDEHKAIYIAISRGESEKAKLLMEEHIRTIRQELSELSI
ncbi:FadR/GntR family transcriptional regulator [Solibacillus silvestris]|uniref:FadR/GntR family transcriptional regulator n=1 Tax=Solibacillus silvestris TaxID=76853 RepID=UPI003F7E4C43